MKTPLFKNLQKAIQLAIYSEESGLPIDELLELPSISRRKFIQNSALASSSLLLPQTLISQNRQPRIAIIGAGIGGLSAGYHLQKAGVNFTLYEASRRAGGRILSVKNTLAEGVTVEYGAEFIDSDHDDMLNYIKEFDLEKIDTMQASEEKFNRNLYYFDGKRHTDKDLVEALKPIAPKILNDARQMATVDYQTPDRFGYDKLSIDEYFNRISVKGWVADLLKSAYTGEYGLDTGEQSSLNFLYLIPSEALNQIRPKAKSLPKTFELFGISDERYKTLGGNQQIPNRIAEKIQKNIKYDHQLEAIIENTNGTFRLKFKGKPEITADIVLMAIPFTVLRTLDLKKVKLPDFKRKSIMEMGYGTNSKLMMGFQKRLWREQNWLGFMYSKDIHTGWDSSQLQNQNQGEASFSVFHGGKIGKEMKVSEYDKFLNEINAVYPNLKAIANGKKAVMNWTQNPYSLGSYTCYKVGQFGEIGMAEGVPHGNMFFVGEHCDPDYQGFMNGGAKSGRETAEKIITGMK
jgi:monoamine oxidase